MTHFITCMTTRHLFAAYLSTRCSLLTAIHLWNFWPATITCLIYNFQARRTVSKVAAWSTPVSTRIDFSALVVASWLWSAAKNRWIDFHCLTGTPKRLVWITLTRLALPNMAEIATSMLLASKSLGTNFQTQMCSRTIICDSWWTTNFFTSVLFASLFSVANFGAFVILF